MSHLLVPHDATSTTATVWVGVVADAPGMPQLAVGSREPQPLGDGWSSWQVRGRSRFWSQRVTIDQLEPGRRYPVSLTEDGTERAVATATTLPDRLPAIDETPFTCLVGSCFAHFADRAGSAGAAFAALPAGARPVVKFLCGDQVYLDAPFPRFLVNVLAEDDLRAELLGSYLATWAQAGDAVGFAQLLRDGATWFGSDDHEVWNNAPLPTPTVRATWWPLGDRGAAWWRIAAALYDDFQTPRRGATFSVGNLSFHILDTRLDRTADRSRFASDQNVTAVGEWIANLDGPGVLVIGQPIFVAPTGPRGHLTDWGLADYGQYADLVRAVNRSEHDLLVLTGDVHYGRVAGCTLPSGAALIEVIASPFALVDKLVGGKWHAPPASFPAAPIPGVIQSAVWVDQAHALATNQFATLEFAADGSRVHLAVRAWPIPPPGQPPTSRLVLERPLQ